MVDILVSHRDANLRCVHRALTTSQPGIAVVWLSYRMYTFHYLLSTQHKGDPPARQACSFVQIKDECRPPYHIIRQIRQAKCQRELTVEIGPHKADWPQHLPDQSDENQMSIACRIA